MDQQQAGLPEPQERERKNGMLKIFFGYAHGVGKTRAMLEAAHRMKEAGTDVVLGSLALGPHAGREARKLAETLPPLRPDGRFDLNAALERRPQLLLLNGLARQNREGGRHRKRYQDIEELLRAGIDVYTTLEVQQLESLSDVTAAITGKTERARIPDRIFDEASRVEVIDLDPEELLARLREENTLPEGWEQERAYSLRALHSLREIALRRAADRIGRGSKTAVGLPADAGEHLLLCLSSAPSNAKVIRTAARMAEAFHSGFTALFVETPDGGETKGERGERLRANLKLAEDLGARIATVYGEDVPFQIAEYARASGVSKIVVGRSNNKKQLFSRRKSFTDRLIPLAPNMDVYIIPDNQPPYQPKHRSTLEDYRFSGADLLKALGAVALSTAVGAVFYLFHFNEANIITIYLLGVLLAALWTSGWLYSIIASLASVMAFNFFFTEPLFTFKAEASYYPFTFLVMLAASCITSSLTTRVKSQAHQSAQKAYRTEVLLETSQKLQQADSADGILRATAGQLQKLLERTVIFYPVRNGELLKPLILLDGRAAAPENYTTPEELAVAGWVLQNNKQAGAGTNTFPAAKCLHLAVRGGQSGVLAVAAIPLEAGGLDAFEKNLMLAMLDECGGMLERVLLHEAKQQVELKAQQEALRANLLRAISHDLRTPLTSITGNAGILMENSDVLDDAKKLQLYVSIYDDSMWLVNLVENLLSVTRIENGTMHINMEPELLDDVFREALQHLDRKSAEHRITSFLSDDLLMARMDARLIVQVIINILNNAVKYTQPGSRISLCAKQAGEMILVEIADDGPGISDEAKPKLFDMFYTADNIRWDGRRGLGLGLALCKSIISAHGGSISVMDNVPRGTIFRFTLQSAEVTV